MTVEQSEASRLGPIFDLCRKDSRAALIGYLPTGYPDVRTSVDAMTTLVESGCDIIEVGVPYSIQEWTDRPSQGQPRPRFVAECGCGIRWPRSRRSAWPADAPW